MIIVANWKLNFNKLLALEWISKLEEELKDINLKNEVVICPPYVLLPVLRSAIRKNNLPFKIGAQDVSIYEEGRYTGEVSAEQLKDWADYVIVGHSERRRLFQETNLLVGQKMRQALTWDLKPIVCVSDTEQAAALGKGIIRPPGIIIAYEPLEAIGTGNSEEPAEVIIKVRKILSYFPDQISVLYGGSVNSENVAWYTQFREISGVLVGTACLDAVEFAAIIKKI